MNIVTATTHVIDFSNMSIALLSELIIILQEGQLGKWKKKAGDSFQRGDCLCDITLDRVIVGVDAKDAGILAKIVVSDYQSAPINSTIALLASDMNEYMDFVANEMADSYEAELQEAVNEVAEAKGKKPDMTVLMRVINHLIKCGSIKQGSGTILINAPPPHTHTLI
jgi:pyruvate/2-oxoglutarate dehydrogenase complex dihydrolipoamide acyltransferase (E2) component